MTIIRQACFSSLSLVTLLSAIPGQALGDEQLVLQNGTAKVSIAHNGGGIVEFRFLDQNTNPLNWEVTPDLEERPAGQPFLRGHFLCLDRWGPPSAAEIGNGVPFHGEAPRIAWQVTQPEADLLSGTMRCRLPLAGLQVRRAVKLSPSSAVLKVSEEVTNQNKRGRIFNMVQHPSIAPPFLDETTLVDSNARHGFWQDGQIPSSIDEADVWPRVTMAEQTKDLRRLRGRADVTHSDVSSFVFDDATEFGWVTASNPGRELLLGYLWQTRDYPWLNIWRYIHQGQVAARGLEFGTTGLHQPFPMLVKTNRILSRPLYEYIDANQSIQKSYAVFLLKIPSDYRGVGRIVYSSGTLRVTERGQQNPRRHEIAAGDLF